MKTETINRVAELNEIAADQQLFAEALKASTTILEIVPKLAQHVKVTNATSQELLTDAMDLAMFINVAIAEALDMSEDPEN